MSIYIHLSNKVYPKLVPNLSHIKPMFQPSHSLSYFFLKKYFSLSSISLFQLFFNFFISRFSLIFRCQFFFFRNWKKNIPKDIHNNLIDSGMYLFLCFRFFLHTYKKWTIFLSNKQNWSTHREILSRMNSLSNKSFNCSFDSLNYFGAIQ